jgi:hypothetical protein
MSGSHNKCGEHGIDWYREEVDTASHGSLTMPDVERSLSDLEQEDQALTES